MRGRLDGIIRKIWYLLRSAIIPGCWEEDQCAFFKRPSDFYRLPRIEIYLRKFLLVYFWMVPQQIHASDVQNLAKWSLLRISHIHYCTVNVGYEGQTYKNDTYPDSPKLTTTLAVVGSIVWTFRGLKKPRSREMSLYATTCLIEYAAIFLSFSFPDPNSENQCNFLGYKWSSKMRNKIVWSLVPYIGGLLYYTCGM